MTIRFVLLGLSICLPCTIVMGQSPYVPPTSSTKLVCGVPFRSGEPVGRKYHDRFAECDLHNTMDGKTVRRGCSQDKNRNTAMLSLPSGALFYDAKLGIDADGSPLACGAAHGETDQCATWLTYPHADRRFINSDKVPYIVIPGGDFAKTLGITKGDLAAVVYKNQLAYAIVADSGPVYKIGEGSIELHRRLGHDMCRAKDAAGNCTRLKDSGLDNEVLYFVFPKSASAIAAGLTPENINERIATEGARLFAALKTDGCQKP